MSHEWKKYLLRCGTDCDSFRKEFEGLVRERSQAFREWVLRMPMMRWLPLRFRSEQEARAAIGLICLLYVSGDVNISFSDDMAAIRHEPGNVDELRAWMKAEGWCGDGLNEWKTSKKR